MAAHSNQTALTALAKALHFNTEASLFAPHPRSPFSCLQDTSASWSAPSLLTRSILDLWEKSRPQHSHMHKKKKKLGLKLFSLDFIITDPVKIVLVLSPQTWMPRNSYHTGFFQDTPLWCCNYTKHSMVKFGCFKIGYGCTLFQKWVDLQRKMWFYVNQAMQTNLCWYDLCLHRTVF